MNSPRWPGRPKHTGVNAINYSLRRLLCTRVRIAADKYGLALSFEEIAIMIGDISQAREHIEAKFYGGMTWENRARRWQLDHIKPLGTSRDVVEFMERCHYSNIQPLWNMDHYTKRELKSV